MNSPILFAETCPMKRNLLQSFLQENTVSFYEDTPSTLSLPQDLLDKPTSLVVHLAKQKTEEISKKCLEKHAGSLPSGILSTQTVIFMGRRLIWSFQDLASSFDFSEKMSGRNHRVYTVAYLFRPQQNLSVYKISVAHLSLKRFTPQETHTWAEMLSNILLGNGYDLCNFPGTMVRKNRGLPGTVEGLPLFLVAQILKNFLNPTFFK